MASAKKQTHGFNFPFNRFTRRSQGAVARRRVDLRQNSSAASNFRLETLEPRILLSADPILEPDTLIAPLVIETTPEEPTITFEGSALTSEGSGQALTGAESLDIDANTAATEADGQLIIRYLFGLRGEALTTGLVDLAQGLRTDPQEIVDFLRKGCAPIRKKS